MTILRALVLIGITLATVASVFADGGIHGGGGSELIGNFVKAAQEEIDQTLSQVPAGKTYQPVLRDTLRNLQAIKLVTELRDENGSLVTDQGLHAYSWPGNIRLLDTHWSPRLADVAAARHNRVEIIHELFRAASPTPGVDTNDEAYRITLQTMQLHNMTVQKNGRTYKIWPNGGGLVDTTAKVDSTVYVDVNSDITGDVELGSGGHLTSSHITAKGGALKIGSYVGLSSGYIDGFGVIGGDSRVASGGLNGEFLGGGSMDISSSSLSGRITANSGKIVIYSSSINSADVTLGYNARITSSSIDGGTLTVGSYASIQNSVTSGTVKIGGNTTFYDSNARGIHPVAIGGASFIYDTSLFADVGPITLNGENTFNNSHVLSNTVIGAMSSAVRSTIGSNVKIGDEVSIMRAEVGGGVTIDSNLALCRNTTVPAGTHVTKSLCP